MAMTPEPQYHPIQQPEQGLRLHGIDHSFDLVINSGGFLHRWTFPLPSDAPHHLVKLNGIVRRPHAGTDVSFESRPFASAPARHVSSNELRRDPRPPDVR
jgi:hypothetical protein